MTSAHEDLLGEFQDFAKTAPTAHSLMEQMAKRLHEKMTRYNWTGFYLVDPADPGYLIVGPYAGSFTPNARIPLDTGLCGAAATTGKVIVVQDVSADPRYLAGSSLVKSEIVVPIFIRSPLPASPWVLQEKPNQADPVPIRRPSTLRRAVCSSRILEAAHRSARRALPTRIPRSENELR